MQKYYLDACIWFDYFENRKDRFRPLGEWALDLIKKIIEENALILYSDLVEAELKRRYLNMFDMLRVVPNRLLIKVIASDAQIKEATLISKKTNIPKPDALHAVIARDNNAILITRDAHFLELQEDIIIKKPEELI